MIKHLKNHLKVLLIASLRVSVVICKWIPLRVNEKGFFCNIHENICKVFKTYSGLAIFLG